MAPASSWVSATSRSPTDCPPEPERSPLAQRPEKLGPRLVQKSLRNAEFKQPETPRARTSTVGSAPGWVLMAGSNWLRFGAFLAPPALSLPLHWPLTDGYRPLFSRHSPLFRATRCVKAHTCRAAFRLGVTRGPLPSPIWQRRSARSRHTQFTTRLPESCERFRNLVSSCCHSAIAMGSFCQNRSPSRALITAFSPGGRIRGRESFSSREKDFRPVPLGSI